MPPPGIDINLRHPSADPVRIELLVPGAIERVGEVDPPPVAADFHHLRAAVQRLSRTASDAPRAGRCRRASRPVSFGLNGSETSYCRSSPRAPAGDVQEPVVEREIDVGDQRRHGLEALQQRRQLFGIGGLGGDLDHLSNLPRTVSVAPSRCHSQIDDERSLSEVTTPTNP